jgi:hypothetical protein
MVIVHFSSVRFLGRVTVEPGVIDMTNKLNEKAPYKRGFLVGAFLSARLNVAYSAFSTSDF